MRTRLIVAAAATLLVSCTSAPKPSDPLADYRELEPVTNLNAPPVVAAGLSGAQREQVRRGSYMVELLGCGACHTDGALIGDPDPRRLLAGSRIGIAFENPLGNEYPGVVYAPNITPDLETGIGQWSDPQIAAAIRGGKGRHGKRRIAVMPWQGYSRLTDDDVDAIVTYLRSIEPVEHRVPDAVEPGRRARSPFVYFGVFERR